MPSHSSDEAEVVDVFEIEPRAELAERIAVCVVEVAVVAAAGQAGEVELDAEMDQLAGRKAFEQVRDFQILAAGFQREAFGDLNRSIADVGLCA